MAKKPIEEMVNAEMLIKAATTEDEVGTVLRMHLLVESLLNWYLEQKCITKELKTIVKIPRDFGSKLSLATAFGLPLPFGHVIYQINVIRNSMAHNDSGLNASQVQEMGRHVNKLSQIDATFKPLNTKFLDIHGSRKTFGSGDIRADFFMAVLAFYACLIRWGSKT